MAEPINLIAKLKIESVDASALGTALGNEIKKSIPSGGMSHPTSRVTESTAKLLGYEAIESPLNRAMKGLTEGIKTAMIEAMKTTNTPTGADAASEAKKAAVSGISTAVEGLGSILEIVLGEALDQIISIIQNIAKTLLMLSGIGIVLKVISDVLAAFWKGFDGVGRIWGLILEMLGKMVTPFANLLIPLLLPFLYISSLVARTLNLILMPLYAGLMKAFSPSGQTMQVALGQIMGGDLMGGIKTIFAEIVPKIAALGTTISSTLQPLFTMLASWITSFLAMNLSGIKDTLENLLGTQLGDMVYSMIEIGYNFVSAIAGFIAQLAGKKTFDSLFGTGKFEKFQNDNPAFKSGTDMGTSLQNVIAWLKEFYDKVSSGDLSGAFDQLLTGVTGVVSWATSFLLKNGELFLNQFPDAAKSLVSGLLEVALTYIPNLVTAINYIIMTITDMAKIINTQIALLVAKVENPLDSSKWGEAQKTAWHAQSTAAFDQANFETFGTATASSLYGADIAQALKDLKASLDNPKNAPAQPGGNTTIIVQGYTEQQIVDKIKSVIEQHDANMSRSGYYQQGR